MRRILAAVFFGLTLVSCGGGGGKSTSTATSTTSLPPPTTTTVPLAAIEVRPPSGPAGTLFQLSATRFKVGETLTFEIAYPNGTTYKGPPHKATAQGTVSANYRAKAGDPAGTYQVKATGDQGTQGAGQFEVTAGSAATTLPGGATTVPGGATTLPGGATTVPGRTTTVPGRTTTVPGRTTTVPPRATTVPGRTTTVPPYPTTT